MKKLLLAGIMSAALLSGCGQGQGQSAGMTQPINAASAQVQGADGAAEPSAAPAVNSGTGESAGQTQAQQLQSQPAQSGAAGTGFSATGDPQQDKDTYCQIKAEKEAVEIEIDNLEAAYRVGSLDEQSFQSQRAALKEQERGLERQEDMLEDMAELYYYQSMEMPQGDIQSLLSQLSQVESQKNEQESQERQLKMQYRGGEITRQDFVSAMKENISLEEELDVKEDMLEDSLERLGWDD